MAWNCYYRSVSWDINKKKKQETKWEDESTITVAYFDHRQTIKTHLKLKPYYFLRLVAHLYIFSSLGTEAKRQEILCEPMLHSKTQPLNPNSITKCPNNILLANLKSLKIKEAFCNPQDEYFLQSHVKLSTSQVLCHRKHLSAASCQPC